MGLSRTLARKAHTLYWRVRYWWFDKPSAAWARASALVLSAVVVVAQAARLAVAAQAPARHAPQHAVVWFVVYLIVALVAAAVVYAMTPKPQQQKPQEANPPSTEDGQAVVDILGTSWIEDYFVLAWNPNGVEKIKAKGKK